MNQKIFLSSPCNGGFLRKPYAGWNCLARASSTSKWQVSCLLAPLNHFSEFLADLPVNFPPITCRLMGMAASSCLISFSYWRAWCLCYSMHDDIDPHAHRSRSPRSNKDLVSPWYLLTRAQSTWSCVALFCLLFNFMRVASSHCRHHKHTGFLPLLSSELCCSHGAWHRPFALDCLREDTW